LPKHAPPFEDFRELFRAHVAFVWRVLRRYGVPERELEDACQEVFLVVHRRLPEFEGRSTLRTWIYAIAVRTAATTRRKARLGRELLNESVPEPTWESDPGEGVDLMRQLTWVEQALAELPAEQREVFALYELERLTIAEVGAALGVPESTALYRLHGARDAVRAFLQRAQRLSQPARAASVRR
jgi:RNA polymerase sigma-70 factor (ECF subfamily)